MSATVVQYPVEPRVSRSRLADGVSVAKKRSTAHVRTPSERIALVLDMDECLVHSKFQNEVEYRQSEYRPEKINEYSDSFEIVMNDGERAVVNKRPGLDRFLEEAVKHYNIYVFTAGLEAYGKPILDALDPRGNLFAGRFYRESCKQRNGMFLKDLNVVRGGDLSRVILVDNNPVSFLMQPSNGIPVPSFYDDPSDRMLESLTKVLASLQDVEDVRPRLHQLFRLGDLLADHQRFILG
ncbi:putative FCP1 domain, HAD superfamily protein [Plasmopara halstedii]